MSEMRDGGAGRDKLKGKTSLIKCRRPTANKCSDWLNITYMSVGTRQPSTEGVVYMSGLFVFVCMRIDIHNHDSICTVCLGLCEYLCMSMRVCG